MTSGGGGPGARISLRLAHADDVAAMAAIESHAFTDPWPASAFRELLGEPHVRVTVAEDAAGVLCGYCVLLHVVDEGEIANVAVLPSRRRRGVGSRLLDDALAAAAERGVDSVYLEVRVSNDSARSLYASRGFLPVGRRRAYYREPLEDALVLRWQRVGDTEAP